MNELAQRLVKARSSHGWSQQELADVSGVAAAQIYRYESGRSSPRTEVTSRLAKALAVPFEWLAYGDGAIAIDHAVPNHPETRYVHELVLNEASVMALDEIARQKNLTREMVVREFFESALEAAIKNPKFRELAAGKVAVLPAAEEQRLRQLETEAGELRRKLAESKRTKERLALFVGPGDLGGAGSYVDAYSAFHRVAEPGLKKPTPNKGPVRSPNARKPKP